MRLSTTSVDWEVVWELAYIMRQVWVLIKTSQVGERYDENGTLEFRIPSIFLIACLDKIVPIITNWMLPSISDLLERIAALVFFGQLVGAVDWTSRLEAIESAVPRVTHLQVHREWKEIMKALLDAADKLSIKYGCFPVDFTTKSSNLVIDTHDFMAREIAIIK